MFCSSTACGDKWLTSIDAQGNWIGWAEERPMCPGGTSPSGWDFSLCSLRAGRSQNPGHSKYRDNYQYYFSLTSKRGYSSSWFWAISPFSINDTIVTVVNSSQASLWLSDSSDYLIAKLFFPWSFGTSLKAYTVAAQIRGLYRSQCINTHLPFSRGGICEAIFGGENYKSHELL